MYENVSKQIRHRMNTAPASDLNSSLEGAIPSRTLKLMGNKFDKRTEERKSDKTIKLINVLNFTIKPAINIGVAIRPPMIMELKITSTSDI